MGLVLSILYFVVYYLSPAYLFGQFADWHIEEIIAFLLVIVSVPALLRSFINKAPQSLALVGLALAVFLSVLIGMRWMGGAVTAFLWFIPNALAFFLVCLHFNTKIRLQALILSIFLVCILVVSKGSIDLWHGVPQNVPPPGAGLDVPIVTGATASPYFMRQHVSGGDWIYRLQGLGPISDPNDFGQLMVCMAPLIFIFWRPRRTLFNIFLVLIPLAVLLIGVFLTHSRGTLLALTMIAILAARRKIGTLPAFALAGCLFAVAMATQFTGGRDISATAGEDRTALWGEGLAALRSHPLFGVGLGNLSQLTENHLTAHNSIVICSSELGMFGLFFWSLFLLTTFRDALVLSSPQKVGEGESIVLEENPFPHSEKAVEVIPKAEIIRLGRLAFLSLSGFMVAGWFLSRALVLTLFLVGGIVEVLYEMALRRGMVGPRMRLKRALPYSALLSVVLIVVMYIVVRLLNLVH